MIDKDTAIQTVLRKLKTLPEGHAMDLRTYKRNRSVLIVRTGEDGFDVVERGYFEERYAVGFAGMKKLLKTLMKREFPRSTKIRLYNLGPAGPDDHVARKKL